MANKVGTKGQIVIEKEIRDSLGIESGWIAIQQLVDDHVEVYFIPPEHGRSLRGSLQQYAAKHTMTAEEWDAARERAWIEGANEIAPASKTPPQTCPNS